MRRGQSEHLDVFDHGGGSVWDSKISLKLVTYRPTLSKFRGGGIAVTAGIS